MAGERLSEVMEFITHTHVGKCRDDVSLDMRTNRWYELLLRSPQTQLLM